jgi:transposase
MLRDHAPFIRAEIKQQPDSTLAELCARLAEAKGVQVSPGMMCHELRHLNLRRKKSRHDGQRETPRVKRLRGQYIVRIAQVLSPLRKHLKCIDESGVAVGLTRLFGRASAGQRVVEATPGHSGAHHTLIAALSWQGVPATWLVPGAMDREAFNAYVAQVLAPTLRRGDIVLMDNLSSHTGPRTRQFIEATGAHLAFLPPYSSDFNPIELCWSKIKPALRAAKARTFDALLDALADAFASMSQADIEGLVCALSLRQPVNRIGICPKAYRAHMNRVAHHCAVCGSAVRHALISASPRYWPNLPDCCAR